MGISFSKIGKDYDETLPVDETTAYYRKLEKLKEEMTPWERVRAIFEEDVFGDMSPQMTRCKDATMVAIFAGIVIGGVGRSRVTVQDWLRTNAHEKFETPQFAQKALGDKAVLGFGDGAFRMGWRLGAFTFLYMLSTACIAAYRGKSGIMDQVGGASAAGLIYKIRDGPKASLSGLVVGGGLGLVAGSLTLLSAKLVGKEPDDLLQLHFQKMQQRNKDVYDRQKALRHKDMSDDLTQFHEHFMSTDDLSMSQVKQTPIGQLKEAIEKKELSPLPYTTLPPAAIAQEVQEFDTKMKIYEAAKKIEIAKRRQLAAEEEEEFDENDEGENKTKIPENQNKSANTANNTNLNQKNDTSLAPTNNTTENKS